MSLWSRNERMRESWELTLGVYVLWVNMGALCTKQLVGSELTLVLWQQCMGSVLLIYKWILSVCVCMFVYRRGRLFIISSFCIVMHERDEKCLNNKLVSGSYSQECSWSALIGKPKIHFSLSSLLFISSSVFPALDAGDQQLSPHLKCAARVIYICIGRERETPQGTLQACYNLFQILKAILSIF